MAVETKFLVEKNNRLYKYPVSYESVDDRIYFLKSPFSLKDDIKSMKGAKWHGFDSENPRKIWSVEDCYRNRFQIDWMQGGNPYEWFDRDLVQHVYPKFGTDGFGYYDLMQHQALMADTGLTYHYQIWAGGLGIGKTLSAIAIMESVKNKWWWAGPAGSLHGIKKEFKNWGLTNLPDLMSYDGLIKKLRMEDEIPFGVILDEAHLLKNATTQRAQAAQFLADKIRDTYGQEGFVILMSGTPSPKSPRDWWSLCEIAWPGFIKEGDTAAFEKRLGFFRLNENNSGQTFPTQIAWKDDPTRCDICGYHLEEGHHQTKKTIIEQDTSFKVHKFKSSENEVENMYERLKGLVTVLHKKDCLDLPEIIYKEINCEPTPSILRVAQAIIKTAPNVISGLTQLRELSDGFQYRQIEDGYETCPVCLDGTEVRYFHPDTDASIGDINLLSEEFVAELKKETVDCQACKGTQKVTKYKRIAREVDCPKEDAIVNLLDENESQERIVIFAGFSGSIDRIIKICHREGWDTIRVDGRGWLIERLDGQETEKVTCENPLDYWTDEDRRVAFVAHPQSGGVSLTLCEQENVRGACTAVFYSNDFNPASRSQAEGRIHRKGMTKGAMIVDIFHLETDRKVLSVLKENRKLELMTLGELNESL